MIGIINKKIIKDLYKEYNTMYFNGVLSLCDCHYIKLDAMGRYTNQNGKGKIWITNDVDWTEETLREVLVHEIFRHGFRFRRQMKRINRDFGLGIRI